MRTFVLFLAIASLKPSMAQVFQNFSAVNPGLFLYTTKDVHVNSPIKYNNGRNIITPTPTTYPWEKNLGNGMPNVIVDNQGNLSLYASCFLIPSPVPWSKVGVMVYTNTSTDPTIWNRPDAGLYWYNAKDSVVETRLSPIYQPGYQATNVVAVDIESLGIYEDTDKGVEKPFKLVYLPQREKFNQLVAGYEMSRDFTQEGVLSGFSQMKQDRKTKQIEFGYDFINGDTHMGYLKQNGNYYLFSRINAKRSTLRPGETLPFPPPADPRDRYRRETVTALGQTLTTGHYDFDIALDRSSNGWEPYSLQPFRFSDFHSDIWWGIATMFGSTALPDISSRQRAELAISNDGLHWQWLNPGVPFLDNGEDPQSDDHGCINMGKPILAGKYSSSAQDLLYYYVASKQRHVGGRIAGVSLATGKYGKWAGLKADGKEKQFVSPVLPNGQQYVTATMSLYEALRHNAIYFPSILADVTDDPRGKLRSELNSYATTAIYAYERLDDGQVELTLLGGSMGSSVAGTHTVSDQYESVGTIDGRDYHTKNMIFDFMKGLANKTPQRIVSLKDDLQNIPVILEARVKNSVFYGLQYRNGDGYVKDIFDTNALNHYTGKRYWSYHPESPSTSCHTELFDDQPRIPNQFLPTTATKGTIAIKATPSTTTSHYQTLLRIYGDDDNNISIYYLPNGDLLYRVMIHGTEFASMTISPPDGKSFAGQELILTVEALKEKERKYGTSTGEDATIFRVSCPTLQFEKIVQQDILWQWKREIPTEADKANARCFAYAQFAAFVSDLNKVTVGAADEDCNLRFDGSINQVEIAEHLPPGKNNDFWE